MLQDSSRIIPFDYKLNMAHVEHVLFLQMIRGRLRMDVVLMERDMWRKQDRVWDVIETIQRNTVWLLASKAKRVHAIEAEPSIFI